MRAASLVTVLFLFPACRAPGGDADTMAMEPGGETATFDVRHELTVPVPEGAETVRVWLAKPEANDPAQKVSRFALDENTPATPREVVDNEGNRYVYYELRSPAAGEFKVVNTFQVTRREVRSGATAAKTRPYTESDLKGMERHLAANRHVVIDDEIRKLAKEIVGDETNPVRMSKRIYDWVLANVQYWVKDPSRWQASKVGSTEYCLTSGTGNCTDFHSLYMSISRAAGIPTRSTYGSFFKESLCGKDQDQSYHCWIEFWAPELGWVPLDVAVADIFVGDFELNDGNTSKVELTTADGYRGRDPAMVEYYFGNLEPRRVTWNRGRDLVLRPPTANGPVNAMPKAYVEIDGKEVGSYGRKLTFREVR